MDLPCRSLRPRRSARAGQSGWRGHRAGPLRLGLTSFALKSPCLESLGLESFSLQSLSLQSFSLAGLAGALLLTLLPPLPARSAERAVIQEILDGDQLFVDGQKARVNQQATAPDDVSTKASRGALAFPGGAVGRINRFSRMRLGQSCFLLESGQVLVSGKAAGCTRSARLSVRGTNYLLEVDEQGESQLSVLEGTVEVEPLKDGIPTGSGPTTVQAGQKLRLSAQGVILALLSLSSGDYDAILRGPLFDGFRLPLPNYGSLESYLRRYQPSVSLPVNLPSAPPLAPSLPTPSLPSIGLPRLF